MSGTGKAAEAMSLLERAGIAARVSVAGQDDDVAVVAAPPDRLRDIAAQAPAIRALGFRYVTIEVGPGGVEAASA